MTIHPSTSTPFDRPIATGSVVESDDITAPVSRLARVARRRIVAVIDPVWPVAGHEDGPASPAGDDVSERTRAPQDVIDRAAELLTARLQPGELISATPEGRLLLQLRREDRAARPVRLQEMAYFALEVLDRLHHTGGVVDLGVGWAPITRQQDPAAAADAAADAASESLRQRDLQPRQDGAHVKSRNPRITWWSAIRQVVWATIGSVRAALRADGRALPGRHRRVRPALLDPGRGAVADRPDHLGGGLARLRHHLRSRRPRTEPRHRRRP